MQYGSKCHSTLYAIFSLAQPKKTKDVLFREEKLIGPVPYKASSIHVHPPARLPIVSIAIFLYLLFPVFLIPLPIYGSF